MLHAREDYQRIQDPENKIGALEPVLLFRAQDKHFIGVLRYYQSLVGKGDMYDCIDRHINIATQWQEHHGTKEPDLKKG